MLDLALMETFCRAVETGSLTKAADALHITKSVVSRRLSTLEETLGARLLARTTRGVSATEQGLLFYEKCARILDDVAEARQCLVEDQGRLVGRLRLAAPSAFGDACLIAPLTQFMADHRDLVIEAHLEDARVDIAGGGYDLALRIARTLDDSALMARKVCAIPFVTVASPAYLTTHGIPDEPSDLQHHRGIFYANTPAQAQWRFTIDGRETFVRIGAQMLTNSGVLQAEAVASGLGVATLPRFFVSKMLEQGRVVPILEAFANPPANLYALFPEREFMPLKVRALMDFLIDWFKQPDNRSQL